MEQLTAVFLAAGVATIWCALAVALGPALGFVDLPDGELKTHRTRAVPLGGIGVFLSVHTGLVVVGEFRWWLLLATAILLALGLTDDRRGLAPYIRLAITVLAGVAIAVEQPNLTWAVVAVLLVVVGVNATNLFDGLDGLAGSCAVVSFLGIGWIANQRGASWAIPVIAAAGLAGFLFWNRPPAKVFLGDNGAYVVGGLLAVAAMAGAGNLWGVAVGVALWGAPLFDLAVTVLRRLRRNVALFAGDRDHTYDRLVGQGWSVGKVSAVFALAQTGWVIGVILLNQLAGPTITASVAAAVGLGLVLLASRSEA